MAKNLTAEQKAEIVMVFESGVGIAETARRLHVNKNTVRLTVGKNRRTLKESIAISNSIGTRTLTDEGRKILSEKAKKACQKGGKIWTKPEQKFKLLLNDCGIGVKFSSDVKEMFNIVDDENATVCFQYPLQRYVCDFVDVDNNIVYAVNGDFWHGNPLLYENNNLTTIQKHNIHHDTQRERYLTNLGYKICVIWESEINWNPELVKEKIRAVSSEAVASGLHPEGRDFEILTAHLDWSEKVKVLWFKKPREKKTNTKFCEECGEKFDISAFNKKAMLRKFCSVECSNKAVRKVDRPSKDQLRIDLQNMSFCAVARKYNVSDNAVRKWIKAYG